MLPPKVSILIPLFNAENYIKETVESALNQTYNNIEIIVVDDHSTDSSYHIVSSIISEKIRLVKNPKKGACAARNYAFELSSGNYIQYLDADDLLSPNKIEEQIKLLLKSDNQSIASCGWIKFANKIDGSKIKEQFINKSYDQPLNWLIDSWNGKGMGQTSIWLTPRGIIEKVGLWNEKLTINQDGEFFCRVLINCSSIIYTNNVFVYYRIENPNSISQSKISIEKAKSLLSSYRLYYHHTHAYLKNKELKISLAKNYLNFLYQFDCQFPSLSSKAWIYIKELNIEIKAEIGGESFKFIAKKMGFSKALFFKRIIYKIKKYGV